MKESLRSRIRNTVIVIVVLLVGGGLIAFMGSCFRECHQEAVYLGIERAAERGYFRDIPCECDVDEVIVED